MSLSYGDLQGACGDIQLFGRYFLARCAFHADSSPSMMVFNDGWWRCLGCERHGTWKTLWNKLKGQPVQVMPQRKTRWAFPNVGHDELEEVCYQAHMDLVGFPSLGWYLDMRGVGDRIETNELGYWDGWYTIPVTSREGGFVTAVFRAAPHVQDATGLRYWCPHAPALFAPDWMLAAKAKHIFIVYGMIDALVLSSLRFPVFTTTAGKELFDPAWLDEYRVPFLIVPDLKEEKAAAGLARHIGWRGKVVRLDYPEGIKDPAGFAEAGKVDELARQLGGLA